MSSNVTASSWGQVLDALRGAITMTLSSFFPDHWLNMTPLKMIEHVFAYFGLNPWSIVAAMALIMVAHTWYFWEGIKSWSKTLAKLGLFYMGLTIAIILVWRVIAIWTTTA